jgi:hypothetical protein
MMSEVANPEFTRKRRKLRLALALGALAVVIVVAWIGVSLAIQARRAAAVIGFLNNPVAPMQQAFGQLANELQAAAARQPYAQQFLDRLRESKADEAYKLTTSSFQRKVTAESLRSFVAQNPALARQVRLNHFNQVSNPGHSFTTFDGTAPAEGDKAVKVVVTLEPDGKTYKVSRLEVGERSIGP